MMIDGAGGMVAGRHPECMMSVTRHGASRSQFFSAREVVRLYVVDGASNDKACDRKGRKFAYELVTSSKTLRARFFETWNAGSRKAGKREATGRGAGKMNASLCAGARGQQGTPATPRSARFGPSRDDISFHQTRRLISPPMSLIWRGADCGGGGLHRRTQYHTRTEGYCSRRK